MILIALAVLLAALTAAKSLAKGEQLKLSNNKRRKPVLSFLVLGLRILQQYPQRLSIARCYLHDAA